MKKDKEHLKILLELIRDEYIKIKKGGRHPDSGFCFIALKLYTRGIISKCDKDMFDLWYKNAVKNRKRFYNSSGKVTEDKRYFLFPREEVEKRVKWINKQIEKIK